jgi:hypothetical protein
MYIAVSMYDVLKIIVLSFDVFFADERVFTPNVLAGRHVPGDG